jgi:alkanesulfonate monooxygenase SsuD/methylene tetrahydromethanopterin reductase-like flavin-dependent oxidoreductase (luciferase family)
VSRPGEDKVEESELREMAGEVLSEMDRDADGAVTKEEFVKAHGPDVPPRPPPPFPVLIGQVSSLPTY